MQEWQVERSNLIKDELVKMFVAFNKTASGKLIDMKVGLLEETLNTLKTDRIKHFFQYLRINEKTLPSDSRMKEILRDKHKDFTNYTPESQQLPAPTGEMPSSEWVSRYMKNLALVMEGKMTKEQAYSDAEACCG